MQDLSSVAGIFCLFLRQTRYDLLTILISCKLLSFRFIAELQEKHAWNRCVSVSWVLAGTQPIGVASIELKLQYTSHPEVHAEFNSSYIARDTNHVIITGSNPITFMDQACSMILWNDARSVSAETGKQWFLPIFFLLTLNCWHGAKFGMLKVFPCVTSNRIQVSDNLRLFQT